MNTCGYDVGTDIDFIDGFPQQISLVYLRIIAGFQDYSGVQQSESREKEKLKCAKCGLTLSSKSELDEHYQTHSSWAAILKDI